MNDAQPRAGDDVIVTDENEASLQAAKRLRRDRPRWVVIWVARTGLFHAYPLFRTRRETALSAAQPSNLAAQMDTGRTDSGQHASPVHPVQGAKGLGSLGGQRQGRDTRGLERVTHLIGQAGGPGVHSDGVWLDTGGQPRGY